MGNGTNKTEVQGETDSFGKVIGRYFDAQIFDKVKFEGREYQFKSVTTIAAFEVKGMESQIIRQNEEMRQRQVAIVYEPMQK